MYKQSTQESDSSDNEEEYMGSLYKSKQDLQPKISHFVIKEEFHYKTDNSNKSIIRLSCKDEHCNWKLIGKKMVDSSLFKIITYIGDRTCVNQYTYLK